MYKMYKLYKYCDQIILFQSRPAVCYKWPNFCPVCSRLSKTLIIQGALLDLRCITLWVLVWQGTKFPHNPKAESFQKDTERFCCKKWFAWPSIAHIWSILKFLCLSLPLSLAQTHT